jgi:hypothetical protein
MSTTSFQVVYDGPALEGSSIDVRYLAPALLAIGKTIEEANACLNGEHTKVSVRVNASFKTGCFGVELSVVQSLVKHAIDFLSGEGITKASGIVDNLFGVPLGGGLVFLIRWLKGRRISKATLLDNGKIRITVDGSTDVFDAESKTIELLRNHNIRKELLKIIEPLEREGIDSITFIEPGKNIEHSQTIKKDELTFFALPKAKQEILPTNEETMTLQLISVSFRGENKWRFSDGISTFYASISDNDFLRRVRKSEISFSAGDVLDVHMHRRLWMDGDTMKSDLKVMEVIKHTKKATPTPLEFDDE